MNLLVGIGVLTVVYFIMKLVIEGKANKETDKYIAVQYGLINELEDEIKAHKKAKKEEIRQYAFSKLDEFEELNLNTEPEITNELTEYELVASAVIARRIISSFENLSRIQLLEQMKLKKNRILLQKEVLTDCFNASVDAEHGFIEDSTAMTPVIKKFAKDPVLTSLMYKKEDLYKHLEELKEHRKR